jgi:hypothetical protein
LEWGGGAIRGGKGRMPKVTYSNVKVMTHVQTLYVQCKLDVRISWTKITSYRSK